MTQEQTLIEQYLLTENRIEFLKKTYKDKISTEHDQLATKKDSDSIIDHFAEHDPTEKKEYTQWMVGQYRKGNVRQEDAHSMGETVGVFHNHKQNMDQKDINSFKHVADLRDAVEPFVSRKESDEFEDPEEAAEGTEKVYDKNGVKAFKINNFAASKALGSGTSWCTNQKEYYNSYTKGKDATHVIVTKEGDKFQLHHSTNQLKDRRDIELDHDNPIYEKYKNEIGEIINQTAPETHRQLVQRFGKIEQKDIDKIKSNNHQWDFFRGVRNLAKNKTVNRNHIDELVENAKSKNIYEEEEPEKDIHKIFGANPAIKESDIRKHTEKDFHDMRNFIENPNAPLDLVQKHAETFGSMPSNNFHKLTKTQATYALRHIGEYSEIPKTVEQHPEYQEIIKDSSQSFHDRHSSTTQNKETLEKYVSGELKVSDDSEFFNNRKLTPEQITKGYHGFGKNSITHLNKIIENPNSPSEIIKNVIDSEKISGYKISGSRISNHAINRKEVQDHIFNNPNNATGATNKVLDAGHYTQEQKHSLLNRGFSDVLREGQGDTPDLINKAVQSSTSHLYGMTSEHHKNLNEDSLAHIAKNNAHLLKDILVSGKHKNVTNKVFSNLKTDSQKREILNHTKDQEALRELFDQGNHISKQRVLSHPNVPEELLQKHHVDPSFHGAISINPKLPAYIARNMAEGHLQDHVKANLKDNKNVPADVKEMLK